jgi:hypothetical protein
MLTRSAPDCWTIRHSLIRDIVNSCRRLSLPSRWKNRHSRLRASLRIAGAEILFLFTQNHSKSSQSRTGTAFRMSLSAPFTIVELRHSIIQKVRRVRYRSLAFFGGRLTYG